MGALLKITAALLMCCSCFAGMIMQQPMEDAKAQDFINFDSDNIQNGGVLSDRGPIHDYFASGNPTVKRSIDDALHYINSMQDEEMISNINAINNNARNCKPLPACILVDKYFASGDPIVEKRHHPALYYRNIIKAKEMISNINAMVGEIKKTTADMKENITLKQDLSSQLMGLLKKVEELYAVRVHLEVPQSIRSDLEKVSVDDVLRGVGYESLKESGLLSNYEGCDWLIRCIRYIDVSKRKYMAVQDDLETVTKSIQDAMLRSRLSKVMLQIEQKMQLNMLNLLCDVSSFDNQLKMLCLFHAVDSCEDQFTHSGDEYDYLDGVADLFKAKG